MKEPLVEIILVNYNNAADTIECVDSLKKITYRNANIIVVDNGSTDSSVQKLKNASVASDFMLIDSGINAGFSAGNNIGIQYAINYKADYVLLLNNDTLVDPNFLTELIKFQESNEQCDVSIGKIYYAYEPKKIWYSGGSIDQRTSRTVHDRYGEIEIEGNKDIPHEVTFATGCFMCMRMSVIEDVGLLDEDYFLYEEDCDYCCRIIQSGKHIYYVPSSVIYHKISASTGETSPLAQYYTARNHLLLIKKKYKGWNKVVASIYTYILIVKRCISREVNWSHTFNGIKAFYKGEIGKKVSKEIHYESSANRSDCESKL